MLSIYIIFGGKLYDDLGGFDVNLIDLGCLGRGYVGWIEIRKN